jgi:hypothetical protein
MFGGTIENDGAADVVADADSSVNIVGTLAVPATVSALSGATWPAIFVIGASSLQLKGATVDGVAGGITAGGTSTVLLRDSSVTNNSASTVAIEASFNSSVISAGGNTLTNTMGNVVVIDHSSSLFENDGSNFGFAGAADGVTGKGLVLVQSSMQLGTGGTTPSTWSGNITVQQNSSFAMAGGMAITGFVHLGQQSNGFFNMSLGGTNGVSSGVSCPATSGNPASHVSNPTAVTPNVTVGSTEEMTTPPACLPF